MLLATFRAKAVSLNPTDWKRAHESFAEYLKSEGALVWKIPEGLSSSFEEAAAMGESSQHTAFMMMFLSDSPLPRPDKPISEERSFPLLI
ncbi:hypothetical protein BT69DRAFT_499850 [Atractiella rhizophila]|nr:hypothetical protein BT69DRAFT_499850 [Atractiella rhizophila]